MSITDGLPKDDTDGSIIYLEWMLSKSLQSGLFGDGNDESMSTLGTKKSQASVKKTHKALANYLPSLTLPHSTTSSITRSLSHSSILTTKVNEMEKDYHQIQEEMK